MDRALDYQDDISRALNKHRNLVSFQSPRTPSCPSGDQVLTFLNSSPINSKDWTAAYFEQ